ERAAAAANLHHAQERLQTSSDDLTGVNEEVAANQQTLIAAKRNYNTASADFQHANQQIETLQAEIERATVQHANAQQQLQQTQADVMQINVEQARVEQKLDAANQTLATQTQRFTENDAAVSGMRDTLAREIGKMDTLRGRTLSLRLKIEQLRGGDAQFESEKQQLSGIVAEIRQSQSTHGAAMETVATALANAQQQLHQSTATIDSLQVKRQTLAERLLEDYQIDLNADEIPEDFQPVVDRGACEAEIAKLRNQLQRSGSVNMEALDELEDLQSRYDELHQQYQDLTAAKESLQRIIGKINGDSRRLFLDTLEAIRQNFQRLYRKSFGGGTADLILEDADDPLEAGVEIIATPPGKPSFSNSLLSGGEKALTAVSLLMAIFQYRPSPFCVLDEVDAPFDEANIGRFVTVLREFLDQTKFVVVTHSKKTMTAANTLYGVTMQESGISKKVAVRFEDVSEDGQINAA
ncbi:MAG: chromosome segregation protein SMC, partial [Planctomycetota bacterium]